MSQLNETEILRLIEQCRGNLSAIAQELSVGRSSVAEFIRDHPRLALALQDAGAAVLDDAHAHLAQHVAEGEPWAIQFVLKTLAPKDNTQNQPDAPSNEGNALGTPKLTDEERLQRIHELFDAVRARQNGSLTSEHQPPRE